MSHWSPYQPTADVPWNLSRVVHLHHRAGFAATWSEMQRDLGDGPVLAVTRLLNGTSRTEGVPENFDHLATVIRQAAVDSGNWYLSLRFGPDCLRNGMDPLSFIRYLSTVGDVVHLSTIINQIPELPQMDAESCYLGFEIVLKSAANKETIESVFEFVRDDSTIRIIAPNSRVDEYIEIINSLSEDHELLGEILVKSGVLTRHELDSCLQKQLQQRE